MSRVSANSLAHSAGVTPEECKRALDTLSSPDPDSRTEAHGGRRIERVEGGFKILNADAYLQIIKDARPPRTSRKDYMREYMAERRRQEREAAGKVINRTVPAAPREFTPPTIEEALAFAERYNNGQGMARGLKITPDIVHSWYDDRKSLGWTVVKHNTQVPLNDWQPDLPKYASTWKRNESRGDLFGGGNGKPQGQPQAKPDKPPTVWELNQRIAAAEEQIGRIKGVALVKNLSDEKKDKITELRTKIAEWRAQLTS